MAVKVNLVVPKGTAATVRFAAGEIERALQAKGHAVLRCASIPERAEGTTLVLGEWGDRELGAWFECNGLEPPPEAEAFLIRGTPGRTVAAIGRDAVGAMYGGLALAEQVEWAAPDQDPAQVVRETTETPFLPLRGINPFLYVDSLEKPDSWYYSPSFWKPYLDFLAQCRFNFLDLHAMWDVDSTYQRNLLPYFVKSRKYPDVGVNAEQAERNLTMLNTIMRMAKERGIRVGLMNYDSLAGPGIWKAGVPMWPYHVGETETQRKRSLQGEDLVAYTREVVGEFLRACPDLWAFGFRIGESRVPEEFYLETYLPEIRALGRPLVVTTRSWGADRDKVMRLGAACPGELLVELKYNGEQLGPPYQAVTGSRYSYRPSGSYEDYTSYPRTYQIVWHVWANGTHRVFHWGDPAFVRRAVRSCQMGEAAGFSLEPMNCFYPQEDYFHREGVDHGFFDWVFQRQWLWYVLWGRLSYNPQASEDIWRREYEKRMGNLAAGDVLQAVEESSKVVPTIYAYHPLGLDARHMAPEMETGNRCQRSWVGMWDGNRVVPPEQGDIDDFIRVLPLDRQSMEDIREYVQRVLNNVPSGKATPLNVAEELERAAQKALEAIQRAAPTATGEGQREYACLRADVEALHHLGRYYAEKIRAAVNLQFFYETHHYPKAASAHDHARKALEWWDRLAEVTGAHYRPFIETQRMLTLHFTWREEGRHLIRDLYRIEAVQRDFLERIAVLPAEQPHRGHVPVTRAKPGEDIEMAATIEGRLWRANPEYVMTLCYRRRGEAEFRRVPMEEVNAWAHTYRGVIPKEAVTPGSVEYFLEWVERIPGEVLTRLRIPGLAAGAMYRITVTEDDQGPSIRHEPPMDVRGQSQVTLRAEVTDNEGVAAVRLRYKPLPSFAEWDVVAMQQTGGLYEATVPLTPEGLQYSFEAIDVNGNGTLYPDFRQATPYLVIPAWEPGI